MRKLVFCNRKGGVGKTASAINVAAALARAGKRTLLIDVDSQANATHVLAKGEFHATIYDVLLGETPAEQAIVETPEPRLFLLPTEERFANFPGRAKEVNEALPQLVMREKLRRLAEFDFVVVDTPTSLDLTTINALAYADEAWVPVEPSSSAVDGIHHLRRIIDALQENFQDTAHLAGVFLTMANPQTLAFREVRRHLRQHFGQLACNAFITYSYKVRYALGHHQSIFGYAPASDQAQQYKSLTREIYAYNRQHAQVRTG